MEIDLSSGDAWVDLRWTNALPSFLRPQCGIEDVPISSGAPGRGPQTVWRALMIKYVVPYDGWVREGEWSEAFDAAVSNAEGCAPCVYNKTCVNTKQTGGGCSGLPMTPSLPSAPWPADSVPDYGGVVGNFHAGDVRFVWFSPHDPNTAPAEGRIVVHVSMAQSP